MNKGILKLEPYILHWILFLENYRDCAFNLIHNIHSVTFKIYEKNREIMVHIIPSSVEILSVLNVFNIVSLI